MDQVRYEREERSSELNTELLHASSLGHCIRQQYLAHTGVDKTRELTDHDEYRFWQGSCLEGIHNRMINEALRRKGLNFVLTESEPKDWKGIRCNADALLVSTEEGVVGGVEFKYLGSSMFTDLLDKGLKEGLNDYFVQCQCYIAAYDLPFIIFMAFVKDPAIIKGKLTTKIKSLEKKPGILAQRKIEEIKSLKTYLYTETVYRDEGTIDWITARADELRQRIERKLPPRCEYRENDWQRGYCDFNELCGGI